MVSVLDLPHAELTRALESGAPVYLSVNPVEYHGPHLPLHCDALISAGIIEELHARLGEKHPEWPLLVATGIEMGVDPVPGPGTRAVPYSIVRDVVVGACRALAELGAKRVVLMTFHGSPLHNLALEAGVRELRKRGVAAFAPLHVLLEEMLTLENPERYRGAFEGIADETLREEMIRELAHDFHGGFFETSVLLHYRPEAVHADHVRVPPCPPVHANRWLRAASRVARAIGFRRLAIELAFASAAMGWYELRPFPGYTSRPHLASRTAGAFFAREIVSRYAAIAEEVFAGAQPPAPVLGWMRLVSLGGRIGRIDVPNAAIAANLLPRPGAA